MSTDNLLDSKKQQSEENKTQHTGIGTQVMTIAEQIAQHAQYQKISVIAWVGVREYYKNKLWYHLEGTYMVKELVIKIMD
jgi:elongator complex protein 3